MATELTRAQYSGLDFDTHLDDLRARIQVEYAASYNDFSTSALGMMLLDHTAFGLDALSFYLDRRTTDLYLETARTRKSVARLTRQIGYKMGPAVASSVDLSVTIGNQTIDVTIPKGFQFVGPDDLIFECAQATTWASSDPVRTKIVPCYQGETVVESFISNGTANQVFRLARIPDSTFVVGGSVDVKVNGKTWEEKTFISFDRTDHFEVGYNDDPATIRFGDGQGAGNIPVTGASIVVTYVASRGRDGQVSKGTINKTKNKLVVSFQEIKMTVDNQLGSVGGDDPESLQHAKTYAPLVYKSRYVSITRSDYEALSKSYADPLFGRVAVAQAISSRSAESDVELQAQAATIRNAIDAPVHIAGAKTQMTGAASVSSSEVDSKPAGTVTGSGTAFTSEFEIGDLVSFGVSIPVESKKIRTVVSIVDDFEMVISPSPSSDIPANSEIYRYGKAIVQIQSSMHGIQDYANASTGDISSIAATVNSTAGAGGTLDGVVSGLRGDQNDALQIKDGGAKEITTFAQQMTNLFSTSSFTPSATVIGSVTNGKVFYVPKQSGLSIVHVSAVSNSVSVAGSIITVNMSPGTNAGEVANMVNESADASAVVFAVADGTGTVNMPAVPLTPILMFMPETQLNEARSLSGKIETTSVSVSDLANTIHTNLGSRITSSLAAKTGIVEIGATPTSGLLGSITGNNDSIKLLLGDSDTIDDYPLITFTGDMVSSVDMIQAAVVSNQTTIGDAVEAIEIHVDKLLSADCKANLVTVPILARDKSGFLAAPSNGLIRSLQRYLDARKEVTQTVQVTNGGIALVSAFLEVRAGVLPSYSTSIIKSSITTAIDGVLMNREFGQSLYVSDLIDAVTALDGVGFVNIRITRPNDHLDDEGNLIISDSEIITKGGIVFDPDPLETVER